MILGKSDIGKLRLKTKLTEAKSILESSPYPSQQEVAKKQLEMLQEEYKALTGEYATEFLIKEEQSEGVYGNNVKYITKDDEIYICAKDVAEQILGPNKNPSLELFKNWLISITNAGS